MKIFVKTQKTTLISSFENFILVREVYYSVPGWTIIGDETGIFTSDDYNDYVELTGEEPPLSKMGWNVNTFLCVVEYEGTVEHPLLGEMIDSYRVMEWHPVYPVVRNSLWPNWMLPSRFMTKRELMLY